MSDPRNPQQRCGGSVWSVPISLDDIPEAGCRVELTADAKTREAVAGLAAIAGLPRLQAVFDLTRHGRDGIRVSGTVAATVDQACVVTLEPVRSEISEAVDLVFAPPAGEGDAAGVHGVHSVDSGEPPEVLLDGRVDLGAVATEFLLLGIDPYPRAEGAVLEVPNDADPGNHPFAALAALRKGPAGQEP